MVGMDVLVPVMIWIGLMGGASYVNVMYLILNSKKIEEEEKELAVNICAVFNDLGVLFAATFSLVLNIIAL
jgi:battenin